MIEKQSSVPYEKNNFIAKDLINGDKVLNNLIIYKD